MSYKIDDWFSGFDGGGFDMGGGDFDMGGGFDMGDMGF